MLRISSLNANGLRSAASKGLEAWVASHQPQILCLQEVKAQLNDLPENLRSLGSMKGHFHLAEKKGYSGVALYCAAEPSAVRTGFGNAEFDAEGRIVELRFDKPGRKLSVVSVYFPSGSSSDERQQAKFRFLDAFLPHLLALKRGREVVLCGDVNIAHQEIDLKNWRSNQKNSGFLPEERAWMSALLGEHGYVDVYRQLHPGTTGDSYTWWSNRGQAWANNVGWRIDYHLATPGLAAQARHTAVYKAQRFSDHAPLTVDYDAAL